MIHAHLEVAQEMALRAGMTVEEDVAFAGLRGLLWRGGSADLGKTSCVVVGHPHPHYGGDMHNNVVIAVCGALQRRGVATLRFDLSRTATGDAALLEANAADLSSALAFARARGFARLGLVASRITASPPPSGSLESATAQ